MGGPQNETVDMRVNANPPSLLLRDPATPASGVFPLLCAAKAKAFMFNALFAD